MNYYSWLSISYPDNECSCLNFERLGEVSQSNRDPKSVWFCQMWWRDQYSAGQKNCSQNLLIWLRDKISFSSKIILKKKVQNSSNSLEWHKQKKWANVKCPEIWKKKFKCPKKKKITRRKKNFFSRQIFLRVKKKKN